MADLDDTQKAMLGSIADTLAAAGYTPETVPVFLAEAKLQVDVRKQQAVVEQKKITNAAAANALDLELQAEQAKLAEMEAALRG